MTEDDLIRRTLEEITADALSKSKPPLGRIATIQAMVDLGPRWQAHGDIKKRLKAYTSSTGDYMFDLQRRYPFIIEKDQGNLLRIRPAVFPLVARVTSECLKRLQKAAERAKVRSTERLQLGPGDLKRFSTGQAGDT